MEFLRRLEYDSLWFLSSFEIDRQFVAQPWFLQHFTWDQFAIGARFMHLFLYVGSPLQDAHWEKHLIAVSGRRLFRIAW